MLEIKGFDDYEVLENTLLFTFTACGESNSSTMEGFMIQYRKINEVCNGK